MIAVFHQDTLKQDKAYVISFLLHTLIDFLLQFQSAAQIYQILLKAENIKQKKSTL